MMIKTTSTKNAQNPSIKTVDTIGIKIDSEGSGIAVKMKAAKIKKYLIVL